MVHVSFTSVQWWSRDRHFRQRTTWSDKSRARCISPILYTAETAIPSVQFIRNLASIQSHPSVKSFCLQFTGVRFFVSLLGPCSNLRPGFFWFVFPFFQVGEALIQKNLCGTHCVHIRCTRRSLAAKAQYGQSQCFVGFQLCVLRKITSDLVKTLWALTKLKRPEGIRKMVAKFFGYFSQTNWSKKRETSCLFTASTVFRMFSRTRRSLLVCKCATVRSVHDREDLLDGWPFQLLQSVLRFKPILEKCKKILWFKLDDFVFNNELGGIGYGGWYVGTML